MTSYQRGDVVLAPMGFTSGAGGKWHPAIVLSSDRYNQETPDVLLASVTSNLQALPHPGDWQINDWQQAGLLKPSLAQTKIATVEASIIGRKLGSLSSADMDGLEQGIKQAIGLP